MAIKSVFKTKKATFKVDYNKLLLDVINEKGTISKCFNMFHNYSIRNQFLAYHQMIARGMEICPINSFSGWNKLNRSINRGEHALWLWQPITVTKKELNPKTNKIEDVEHVIFVFRPKWFALCQTNGAELKQAEDIKIGDFDFNKVYKKFNIEIIPYNKLNGNIQGFARVKVLEDKKNKKQLAINPLAEDVEMTLLHEITHLVLEHATSDLDSSIKELEAETTAYIVGSVMGIDEEQLSRSRGYIQGWFKENKIPEKNATRIMNTAQKILTAGLGLKKGA